MNKNKYPVKPIGMEPFEVPQELLEQIVPIKDNKYFQSGILDLLEKSFIEEYLNKDVVEEGRI